MCADEFNELTWTDSSIKAFNALKDQTAKSVLVLPSPSEKLKLCTDASQDCVGACLLTEAGQPVSFASKKLTPSQCRWSTIEKEAFAVVWSVQKLRSFLLGKHFTVFSDHQPLKYLLQANNVSPKVLRWRAMVGEFDFDVKYIPGGENVIADSLSRVFSIADVDADSEIQLSQETFLEFQKRDPECQALYKTVAREYSRRPRRVSHVMWSLKKKLTIKQSLLHVNDKIFVPLKLRTRVLTATHYGHQGIENMQRKLSADYFWPNMKKNVHDFVRNCRICSMIKPKFVNAQLKPYLLDAPLQLVVTDYIGPLPTDSGFRYILVILDAFSRFPEIYPVKDMSANTLIAKFRDYFARYGFPDAILSDNGTQFRSKEFQNYCARFNIKKKFTNTYRPSSNGICERFNGSLQKKIKCLLMENEIPSTAWTRVLPAAAMAMRNDVNRSTGFTPSQLFLAFRVRDLSLVPFNQRYLSTQPFGTAARNVAARRHRANSRRRFEDRMFEAGTEVLVKAPATTKLSAQGTPAVVVAQRDAHTVAVDIDGRMKLESTARVSPLPPAPTSQPLRRSQRTTRRPPYLEDYIT